MVDTEGATDWRFLALIVAVISLVWNVANTGLTLWLARRSRRRSAQLEEFRKSIRDPLRDALNPIESLGRRARALSESHTAIDQLREQAVALNKEAVDGFGHLQDALYQADTSILTTSDNWESRCEVMVDKVLNRFNEANNPVHNEAKIREALRHVHADMRTLTSAVLSMINTEVIK